MLRVVYRWQVESENFDKFKDAWRGTTHHIHETVEGALGSFLLRSAENCCEVLTVAKWASRESWQAFWGEQNPEQMQLKRALGDRLSVEVYEEIEDHTR